MTAVVNVISPPLWNHTDLSFLSPIRTGCFFTWFCFHLDQNKLRSSFTEDKRYILAWNYSEPRRWWRCLSVSLVLKNNSVLWSFAPWIFSSSFMFDALIINIEDSCSFLYKSLSEFMLCTKPSLVFAFGGLPSASSILTESEMDCLNSLVLHTVTTCFQVLTTQKHTGKLLPPRQFEFNDWHSPHIQESFSEECMLI